MPAGFVTSAGRGVMSQICPPYVRISAKPYEACSSTLSRSSSITTRKLVTSSRRWPHWYTVYSVSTQRRQRNTTTSAGTPHAIARRGSEFGEVVANSLQAISRRLFLRGSRHFQNLIRGSGGLTVQSRDGMEAEPGSDSRHRRSNVSRPRCTISPAIP